MRRSEEAKDPGCSSSYRWLAGWLVIIRKSGGTPAEYDDGSFFCGPCPDDFSSSLFGAACIFT